MKIAFIGSCRMRLIAFYLSVINRVESSKWGCALKDDTVTVSQLKEFDLFEQNFSHIYKFNLNEIFLYNIPDVSSYIGECDFIFWDRFGFRPSLEAWSGSDCDDVSDPNNYIFNKQKIYSLIKPTSQLYEVGRLFYSPCDMAPMNETIRLENLHTPAIRCSEIVYENIDRIKLCTGRQYHAHFPPFVYLCTLNKILKLLNLEELTSAEFSKLDAIPWSNANHKGFCSKLDASNMGYSK